MEMRDAESALFKQGGGTWRHFRYAALAASVAVSFGSLIWVLCWSGYGFDLTDESLYILWLSHPEIYRASVSQFGFIYHPLYRLVGGDIALLRQANVLVFFVLAFAFGILLFQRMMGGAGAPKTNPEPPHGLVIASLSLSFASISFLGFLPWQPTPSYNTLGGQALLLAAIGILLATRDWSWRSIVGWCLIGVAGWLSFMAKPTSAAALGMAVALYLLVARRFELRLLLVSAATAVGLLLISAWMIDGSIMGFVDRMMGGLELYKKLMAGYGRKDMLRLGQYGLTREDAKVLGAVLAFLVTSLVLLRAQIGSQLVFAVSMLVCAMAIAIMLGIFDFVSFYKGLGATIVTHKSLGTKSVSIVLIGIVLFYIAVMHKQAFAALRGGNWPLILLFMIFPYVYVIGTSLNYWFTALMAGIFWVIAALLLIDASASFKRYWELALPVLVVSQLLTVAVAAIAMEYPYRQPQPLRLSQTTVPFGEGGGRLGLSQDFANYVLTLRRIAQAGGFRSGDPILDFTGQSPGAAVALGAKAVGQPWLLGGYRGSRNYVEEVLASVPCGEMARAWILTGPGSKRALPLDILTRFGVDIGRDYTVAGTVMSEDQDRHAVYEQILHKPLRSVEDGESACQNKRSASLKRD